LTFYSFKVEIKLITKASNWLAAMLQYKASNALPKLPMLYQSFKCLQNMMQMLQEKSDCLQICFKHVANVLQMLE
jgi:hypothetical protein